MASRRESNEQRISAKMRVWWLEEARAQQREKLALIGRSISQRRGDVVAIHRVLVIVGVGRSADSARFVGVEW